MALDELKIPETANKSQDVTGLITRPSNSPQINNAKFEMLVKNVMRKAFNDLIDGITSLFSNKIVGEIKALGGSAVPSGTLLCDGSAVSRTTYARLFAAIGTTWGAGNGSTTFNLPDLRGKALIGTGTATSGTVYSLAGTGGAETHTITAAELPAGVLGSRDVNDGFAWEVAGLAAGSSFGVVGRPSPNSTAFSNMQPYSVINYVIVY